ncbi:MAG: serine/threonine-protein kinase, partial [Acidimicrobiia bacterium]
MPDNDGSGGVDLGVPGLEDAVLIGRGGFAVVYRAYQPAFRRTVAVKVVSISQIDDLTKERFARECQAMGLLSEHPSIVTVLDAGFLDGARPFLVMSYMPNGSLDDRLRTEDVLPWQEAAKIGVKLAGALDTAHQAGILHRDVKPANVLVSQYGEPQLADFGIARVAGGPETTSGVITASLAFAPPEVMEGQRPTVASDVYSLGATVYALMGGASPFQRSGESVGALINRVLNEAPPDLRTRGIPEPVWQVVEQSLRKTPEDRQQTAADFGAALRAAEESLGVRPSELTLYAPPPETLDRPSLDEAEIATEQLEGATEVTEPAATPSVAPTEEPPSEPDPADRTLSAPLDRTETVAAPTARRVSPWRWAALVAGVILVVAVIAVLTGNGDPSATPTTLTAPAVTEAPGSGDPLYAGGAPSGHEEARDKLCPNGMTSDRSGENLSRLDLSNLDLNCTDFRGAIFGATDLTGSTLWGADLTGADLRTAVIRPAQFQAAVLVDADLRNVRLSGG